MQKDEDFSQIKQDLINEIKGMRQDMNRHFEMLQSHETSLYGDKKDAPGVMEDVRSLKKIEQTRQRHMFAIWSALFIGIAERCFHYLTGR